MVYEVPPSKASIKQNCFEFRIPGEKKTRALPLLKYTSVGYRNRLAALAGPVKAAKDAGKDPEVSDLNALGVFQLEMLEKFSPGVTDAMDDDQLGALLKAWQEASNITVGE